jgi:hypothetical protein
MTSILLGILGSFIGYWLSKKKNGDIVGLHVIATIMCFLIGICVGMIVSHDLLSYFQEERYVKNNETLTPIIRLCHEKKQYYYVRQIIDDKKASNEYHLDRQSDHTAIVDNETVPVRERDIQVGEFVVYGHRPANFIARIFCYTVGIMTLNDTYEIIVPYGSILRDEL